jgi:hypothetical protein
MSFELNPEAIKELLSSPEAVAALGTATKVVEQNVRKAAPRRTGAYQDSITSGVRMEDGMPVGFVGSTSPFWHLVEFGSVNNQPYRPLARGAEASSLDYQSLGR